MTPLNPLPWPIAYDMDAIKYQLVDVLGQIRMLNRPVPLKAIYRAKSMRRLLDEIIAEGEQNMEDVA